MEMTFRNWGMCVFASTFVVVLFSCDESMHGVATEGTTVGSEIVYTVGAQEGPSEFDSAAIWDAMSSCATASWGLSDAGGSGGAFIVDTVERSSTDGSLFLRLVEDQRWGAVGPPSMRIEFLQKASQTALGKVVSDLAPGEKIGLIFRNHPFDTDCGPYCVFRRAANGGFTNGLLFTQSPWTLEEIGSLFAREFSQLAAGEECRPDVRSDIESGYATQGSGPEGSFAYPGPEAQPLPKDFDPDSQPAD